MALLCVSSSARVVNVVLLHTANQGGEVLSLSDDGGSAGGLIPALQVVEAERSISDAVIAIDMGNSSGGIEQAGPVAWRGFCSLRDAVGYDFWLPGLDDFESRLLNLQTGSGQPVDGVVAANIELTQDAAWGGIRVDPFRIVKKAGLSMAVVGLIDEEVRSWKWEGLMRGSKVTSYRQALNAVMPDVKKHRPDITILLVNDERGNDVHGPAPSVKELAVRFPELDLVIVGGRGHAKTPTTIRETTFIPAPGDETQIGRIHMAYDTVKDELVALESAYLDLGDYASSAINVSKELNDVVAFMGETVGTVEQAYEGGLFSAWDVLICRVLASNVDADVVLHRSVGAGDLATGSLTRHDIWSHVPYIATVGVALCTPAELRELLEENAQLTGTPDFLLAYGLHYALDPAAKKGDRIGALRKDDGAPMHGRQKLRVAFSGELLASAGGRYSWLRACMTRPEARLRVENVDTHLALVDYVREQSPIRIDSYQHVAVAGDVGQ